METNRGKGNTAHLIRVALSLLLISSTVGSAMSKLLPLAAALTTTPEDSATTAPVPVTHRRRSGDTYNYQNFPVPHDTGNQSSPCNVPEYYKGIPHICDVDHYLNETTC